MKSKKQSPLLSKHAYSRLLKQLCDDVCPFHEPNENLNAGLKKCGLDPLNVQPVLQRLPGGIIGLQTLEESSL